MMLRILLYAAMPASRRGASLPEVCPHAHGPLRVEQGVLAWTADQLAFCSMWAVLWRKFYTLDVYCQDLPLQHGLSYGQSQLCLWHVCRHDFFP